MAVDKREQELIDLLEPLALQHGLNLVDLDVVGGSKSPTIRVYLDGPAGIGFDELASANQWVGDAVEERDPFPGAYMLEVSSAGIDRPLRTRADFVRFTSEDVRIKLVPGARRSRCDGVLIGMQEDDVIVEVNGESIAIPYDDIRKAHIKGRVDFSGKDE